MIRLTAEPYLIDLIVITITKIFRKFLNILIADSLTAGNNRQRCLRPTAIIRIIFPIPVLIILKGNQQNPYIYLGKNIDAYPYYQYTLIGDLKYVMRMASESVAADTQTATEDTSAVGDTGASDADIDNSGDATGGDVNSGVKITLEDDQTDSRTIPD